MKVIRLAIRSIFAFRTYSGINIVGMALSLVCVITIFRYVYGELTVDRFNKNLDRICLAASETSIIQGELRFRGIYSPNISDIGKHPGIEKTSDFIRVDNDHIEVNDQIFNATVLGTDNHFFYLLDYPIVSGAADLGALSNALITQRFAQKVFGEQNPTGKTFRYSNGDILTITGVIGQTATKSSLTFDLIVPFRLSDNGRYIKQTLVLLYPGIDYQSINKQHDTFVQRSDYSERYQLFPLSKVYFHAKGIQPSELFKQGNYNHVAVFIAVGILILLAGIINYVNVYTVVLLSRRRELGVKKVFGAGRGSIFMQLLTENYLLTGLSIVVACIVANAVNPFVVNVLQLSQTSCVRFDIFLLLLFALLLPVLTTLYPYLRHQYAMPVDSLQNIVGKRDTGSLRRIFLSFQYMITFFMIIVSLFFVKQLRFMLDADPGFRTKDIIKASFKKPIEEKIIFTNLGTPNADGSYKLEGDNLAKIEAERAERKRLADEITQKMNASPLFMYWTNRNSPLDFSSYPFRYSLPGGEFQDVCRYVTNENWLRLFDMKLVAGRFWDDKTEFEDPNAIIVTESFLKLLGISDFNSVLLHVKAPPFKDNDSFSATTKIVGVIKDFNYLHLSQKAIPVAMYYSSDISSRGIPMNHDQLIAAVVPGRTQDAIDYLKHVHGETVGGEFSYSFLEDEINSMYMEDKKIASIYTLFTVIAIFVSALGLFSMSLFDIRQRRKEITIRKINGATFSDVIRLLLKKYFWTLGVSFVIATPIALFAIQRYLEDFANKASISWWLFAFSMILTAGISLLTLLYQTLKAANQNPAEVIKNE